jgi:ParB family chromosome partitioning protein
MLALADKDKYDEVLEKILKGHLNVRQTEKLVEQYNSQPAQQTEKFRPENKFYVETALSLKEQTGRNVNVKAKGKGGVLSIEFFSDEDLMRLTELLAK